MTRFALTKTTPLLLGMLALAACPGDETPIDTEGTSTGEDTTSMGPTTTPMTTTVDPDSGSGSGSSSAGTTVEPTTGGPVCDPECEAGECCVAGSCFSAPAPVCEGGCAENEVCACPEGVDPCDCEGMGICVPPVCPLPPLDGNYADCLDDMGVTSDEPCAGAGCVVDNDAAPTAAVCVASGCDNVCQCPAAPETGDAPVNCEDVTGDMVNDCWLACDAGQDCPDGMSCFGGFICLFSNNAPVDVPLFGDCVNVPGATCTDGFCVTAGPDGGVCSAPCADAGECVPAPGTGDAVVTCSDVTGDMMDECWLSCQMGETCPDGMECFGGFVCIWPTIVPPPPTGDAYGDCANNPAGTCQPGEDTCLADAGGTGAACSQSGCADAGECPGAPATGDAPVACNDLGGGNTCYLDCAGGQTCPDGMVCTDMGGGDSACLWTDNGLLLDEDFEQGFLRPGWSLIDADGNTPDPAVAFVDAAYVVTDEFEPGMNFGAYSTSWYMPAGMADDWIITPQITLGLGSVLSWDAWAPDASFPDGYEVRISTGMPTEMDFMANAALFTIADEADVFTGHMVDLAAAGYMNQDVYIAFRNNSNDEFVLVVDNVQITE